MGLRRENGASSTSIELGCGSLSSPWLARSGTEPAFWRSTPKLCSSLPQRPPLFLALLQPHFLLLDPPSFFLLFFFFIQRFLPSLSFLRCHPPQGAMSEFLGYVAIAPSRGSLTNVHCADLAYRSSQRVTFGTHVAIVHTSLQY